MRTILKYFLIIMFLITYSLSTNINTDVFRIGGLELPPYGFGFLVTRHITPSIRPTLILPIIMPEFHCGWEE